MKLILFPLACMALMTMLAVTGLGQAEGADTFSQLSGSQTFSLDYSNSQGYLGSASDGFLYDNTDTIVCWYNMTVFNAGNEQGTIHAFDMMNTPIAYAVWRNSTGDYILLDESQNYINFEDFDGYESYRQPFGTETQQWFLGSSMGWIALIAVIMGVGSIVGVKILGSGESEFSVALLVKGVFFITIWSVLSLLSYPLLIAGGFIIFIIYFGLTLGYTVGIITSIGGSGGND